MGGKRKRGAKDSSNLGPGLPKRAKGDSKIPHAATRPSLEPAPFVEAPIADERRREAALYDLLGSEDEGDRIAAADCIVSSLLGDQGVPEPVLQRHLDRRLFRGLASGRNASRLGFSLVITEIMSQLFGQKSSLESKYPGLTFDSVLALLVDKTQAVGSLPGQEERDHYFGQLFGIECFVRSGVVFADTSKWDAVLDLLLKLGNKKVWLRSQCGWVLVQALEQMSEDEVKNTLLKVEAAGLAKTPEGAAAWLVALNRYPKLRLKPWRNPLSSKSLSDLAAVLKESFKVSNTDADEMAQGNGKQVGWSAQLHFVWDIILGCFVKGGAEADLDGLNQFWSRVVDDGLFSKNATDGQKFKGFMVFQKMLQGLVDQDAKLECLFSKNFMTCLMNQAAKEDRYLHRAAVKTLKAIEGLVSTHPGALVPVLRNLLGKNGVYSFDQRTSTKTVDKLLQIINLQSAEGALAVIRQPIASLKQRENDEAKVTLRLYADYLSKVLNAFASDAPAESLSDAKKGATYGPVLQELSALAYSQPEGIPQGALTEQLRDHCRSRIESSLARLTRRTDDFKTFCGAVASIDPSSRTMTEEIKSAINDALSRMKKLLKNKSKKQDEKGLAQGLAMLHAVSIFQLYNENPDAMEVLDDLAQFSDRLKTGHAGDGGEGSSELLVEILLSMVARPSSLMRQISQQVFDAFTGQISAQGLALLTDPLASGESTRGEKELFNTEEDGMEVDGSGSSDEDAAADSDVEIDSDVEFVGLAGSGEGSDEEGGDEEESGDYEQSGDDEDKSDAVAEGQAPQDLDELVGKILNSHRLDKDDDAVESCSDGDMSDSEMLALDEKLAEVFRQRTKSRPDSKKQKKDAKQSVVNFKHRILDLVDVYVGNEALNPLAFSLLVPLLRLMRTTSAKPLASRACEIILNYQRGCKKARGGGGGREGDKEVAAAAGDLLPLLLEVHGEAAKDNSHAYSKAASAASLIVASAMFAADREAIKQMAAVYAKTQSEWVLGEARLQNSFFADWNNWCQNHASQARS
ncbi:DNA polymerase phi domain-containing protein [Hirsutella rhossiliensis]|uniref:DNA polymerase phi domain-containing protein n=1 Tax=Hirsutella rhossiliensis TaxID=111463 RepID=A0A9P8MXC4_9HYPO|nr:DNA polymerase phi domain-containing protein [Hirsutella rhossiliensis]KAH0960897.1 DNA polymerase phi domain-containing protein [Hirsutella rhossiliensis]